MCDWIVITASCFFCFFFMLNSPVWGSSSEKFIMIEISIDMWHKAFLLVAEDKRSQSVIENFRIKPLNGGSSVGYTEQNHLHGKRREFRIRNNAQKIKKNNVKTILFSMAYLIPIKLSFLMSTGIGLPSGTVLQALEEKKKARNNRYVAQSIPVALWLTEMKRSQSVVENFRIKEEMSLSGLWFCLSWDCQ